MIVDKKPPAASAGGHTFEPVDRITLRSTVVDSIRDAIVYGALKPGTQLIEGDLAGQLGTSRAPVREALRQLHQEGLVTSVPYKGHFVADITPEDMRELFTLRVVLERFAVRLATKNITPTSLARLKSLVQQMDEAAATANLPEVVERDLEFHRLLCELSGHKLLLSVWTTLIPHVRRFIATKGMSAATELSLIVRSHTPIVQALEAGNAGRTEREVSQHLRHMAELVLGRLDSDQP